MAACKNSANPNGPVTRSRIKPSFFICYTLERLWPLPQPKRLRCDIVHGHLDVRCLPQAVSCRVISSFFVVICYYLDKYKWKNLVKLFVICSGFSLIDKWCFLLYLFLRNLPALTWSIKPLQFCFQHINLTYDVWPSENGVQLLTLDRFCCIYEFQNNDDRTGRTDNINLPQLLNDFF